MWSHLDDYNKKYSYRCFYERTSKQLLEEGAVITPLEQAFADAVTPAIDNAIQHGLMHNYLKIDVPVTVIAKDGTSQKLDLMRLRYDVIHQYSVVSVAYERRILNDIRRIEMGHVIWENDT